MFSNGKTLFYLLKFDGDFCFFLSVILSHHDLFQVNRGVQNLPSQFQLLFPWYLINLAHVVG